VVTAALQRQNPSPAANRTPPDLETAVRAFGAEFKARAAATEKNARVPAENVEALRRIGFFKLVQPQAFVGYEADFEHLVDLTIEIGRSCATAISKSTSGICRLATRSGIASKCLPVRVTFF
jgi:alkylation response protein AidB-like acyl-CoA dehydrogenase